MTKDTKHQLARLQQVLDTYGPESARWPEPERTSLVRLAETEPEGRRLFAEAKALARAMDSLPPVSASETLKARIVDAAVNDHERDAKVVSITAGAAPSQRRPVQNPYRSAWPAAALAASFALGVYLGVVGVGGQAVQGAFQISGLAPVSGEIDSGAWLDEGPVTDAEDVL